MVKFNRAPRMLTPKHSMMLLALLVFATYAQESLTLAATVQPAPSVLHTSQVIITPLVIGLALGGGAAKGFAHIGVIKALAENGIHIQIVTGTSAGSLVGSLYAYGYNPAQLQQISYQIDEMNLADFTFNRNGVIKGQRLQDFINARVKNTPLQQLKLKFTAVATDLDSGQSIGFNNGNTGSAVRASCSIPNVFIPVTMNHHRYVDGGLSAPVPVSYAKKAGANFIIAVDISAKPNHGSSGYLANFDQTINIMALRALSEQLKQADIVISPDISQLPSFSFDKKQQAIEMGYNATLAQLPLIKTKLAAWYLANTSVTPAPQLESKVLYSPKILTTAN